MSLSRSASKNRRGSGDRSRSSSPEERGKRHGQGGGGKSSRPLFGEKMSRVANMSATAKVLGCLRSNVLTILNILGVFSGVVVALILRASREEKWTQREIIYVGFIGNANRWQCRFFSRSLCDRYARFLFHVLFYWSVSSVSESSQLTTPCSVSDTRTSGHARHN